MYEKVCKEEKEVKCTKTNEQISDHVFAMFISSMISIIACLPLTEFESKPLAVIFSKVPCRKGTPITLIIAECSNRVLMKYNDHSMNV